MEDCGIDSKRLSINLFSFEDDCLIGSPFSRSPFAQPSPSPSPRHTNKPDEIPKSAEHEGGTKNVHKYNLRKSLAWDSEFFTSPGVLEPDELTSMIESAEKTEKHVLPRILEETQRSTNSISTLASDSLTTSTRLEDGFFEDKRASIQRSGKASTVEKSSRKARSVVSDSQTNQSAKKKDQASHGKLKPNPSPMKLSVGMAKSWKATNPVTIHPRVLQLRNNYTGGHCGSSPSKQPKPETPKRDSIRSKAEKNNTEGSAGRRASSSKIHAPSVSHSISPGPSSSRYTSSPSAAKNPMTSSVDSVVSGPSSSLTKSDVITKEGRSSYASVLKKPPPRAVQSVNGLPRSGHALSGVKLSSSISLSSSIGEWSSKSSTTKGRSKGTRASTGISTPKIVPRDGGTSTHRTMVILKRSNDPQIPLLSTQSTPNGRSASSTGKGTNSVKPSGAAKLLSSIMSPASSISQSFSASLSSGSTTKSRSSSTTARAGNSSQKAASSREGGIPGTSKSPRLLNDQQLDGQKHKMSAARPAQHGRNASTGRLVVKPSALKMPSPKIGFFDGGKSGRTPKGTKQQLPGAAPSSLPKIGAKTVDAADEGIDKLRVGANKSPRGALAIGSKKAENQKQSASGATSRSHQEPSSSLKNLKSPKEVPDSAEQDGYIVVKLRDKESLQEVKSVKNKSIGVKIGGEDPAAKVESVATSKEHQVTDQLTGGGARMPFAAIHSICNVDESSDVSGQLEKRIKISTSTSPTDRLDVEKESSK